VTVREGANAAFYFLLNFADGPRTLALPPPSGAEFLAGAEGLGSDGGTLTLPHRGRAVLRVARTRPSWTGIHTSL
jgi:hypothetical protein